MKKLIAAMILSASMFAVHSGGSTATASTIDPPEIGGCRWQCSSNNKWYTTAPACDAACTGFCDKIC